MQVSKTKAFTVLFALLATLQAVGVIHLTPETLQALQTLLGAGAAWGFRDALSRIEAAAADTRITAVGGPGEPGGHGGSGRAFGG